MNTNIFYSNFENIHITELYFVSPYEFLEIYPDYPERWIRQPRSNKLKYIVFNPTHFCSFGSAIPSSNLQFVLSSSTFAKGAIINLDINTISLLDLSMFLSIISY